MFPPQVPLPAASVARAWVAALLAVSAHWTLPAVASEAGAALFDSRCAACHAGGGNILAPGKSLEMSSLQRDGYGDETKIVELLRVGKGRMPAYQGKIPKASKLDDAELQEVAQYVLEQAGGGWGK
mmetsp:Transcript_53731/g.117238  ORF Transcript_53731/g.117238 Transcript_53731/m.117238 type:complete len:126 (-) Transcript_53731:440-817(-)